MVGDPVYDMAVVGLTNSFNMADGLDGLAVGYMLIGLLLLSSAAMIFSGNVPILKWITILFSCLTMFFLINIGSTPLNKVFLGDGGSLLLGFWLSWICIYFSQDPVAAVKPVAALWCVILPVGDSFIVITRRLLAKRSPFGADRTHLHHILLSMGLSSRLTLSLLMLCAGLLGLFGIFLTYYVSALFALIMWFFTVIIFGACCSSQLMRPNRETE